MHTRVIAVAAVVVLAGCGVPTSDDVSTAKGDEVPFGLLERHEAPATTLPELAGAPARVWLVGSDGIVPVARAVASPVTLSRVLDALTVGATAAETAFGLRSVVSAEAIGGVQLVMGVATVDLDEDFVSRSPREQLLALAQLVFTAFELDDVEVVTFTLGGQPVDVPRADGSISDGPVTRFDYADLVAR